MSANNNNNNKTEIKRVRKTLPKVITLKNSQNLRHAGGISVSEIPADNINETHLSMGALVC
ncbi:MAG: hypothetical protein K2X77_25445 [Candidatus Obscuribacterales bacterium]|nr:hypothetical protein [Candidatus Obscuribacterales bacterium]